MLKLVGVDVPSIEQFMSRYRVRVVKECNAMGSHAYTDGPSGGAAPAAGRCARNRGALE
jgi:hypothetical protein